jgi:hypothetical protein
METCRVVTTVDQDVWYVKEQIVLTTPSLEFSMISWLCVCIFFFPLPRYKLVALVFRDAPTPSWLMK